MSSNKFSIRKAKKNDLIHVMHIIKACTEHMISNNIFQWNDKYPSEDTFKAVSYTHLTLPTTPYV